MRLGYVWVDTNGGKFYNPDVALVAQWKERLPSKQWVGSSNLSGGVSQKRRMPAHVAGILFG